MASVATFMGAGPPRFYLPVDPESPYQSYAQFIVNVQDYRDIDDLMNELHTWFQTKFSPGSGADAQIWGGAQQHLEI